MNRLKKWCPNKKMKRDSQRKRAISNFLDDANTLEESTNSFQKIWDVIDSEQLDSKLEISKETSLIHGNSSQ